MIFAATVAPAPSFLSSGFALGGFRWPDVGVLSMQRKLAAGVKVCFKAM